MGLGEHISLLVILCIIVYVTNKKIFFFFLILTFAINDSVFKDGNKVNLNERIGESA